MILQDNSVTSLSANHRDISASLSADSWPRRDSSVAWCLMTAKYKAMLLLDFDGTITMDDSDLLIADALLGGPRARRICEPLVRAYENLEISTEEYFEGYLRGLGASFEKIRETAKSVPIRPGLISLVDWCQKRDISVRVLSEGLRLYIEPIMRAAGVSNVPVSANEAYCDDSGSYKVVPPADATSCDRCLNCKGAHVRRAQAAGCGVALVGNGASDLCGARLADLVLARDTLLQHCLEFGLPCVAWTQFLEVRDALRNWLAAEQI